MSEMTTAQRCPVCEGRGSVGVGFYAAQLGTGLPRVVSEISGAFCESCRACNGVGVVWRNLLVPQRSADAELTPEEVQQTARLIFGWHA